MPRTVARPTAFLLFFVVALALLGGMHFYLWARLVRDTALPELPRRVLAVFFALAALAVPLGMVLMRRFPLAVTRALVAVLFTWTGAAFLLFVALVATDLARVLWAGAHPLLALLGTQLAPPPDPARRAFVAQAVAGGALLAAGSATAASVLIATGEPRVVEVPLRLERFPKALSGFTLAQITDLHIGPTIREKHVKRVVDLTNALRPDAVVITGDLVDGSVAELRAATGHLARLSAKHGVYFVSGNHEYYSGASAWFAELRRYGIRILSAERVALGDRGPGGASFDLAGIDDWSVARAHDGRWPSLDLALRGRDRDRSLVLLQHQPRGLDEAAQAGVELQLSGHTHGGQLFPWNLIVKAVYPYYKGLYLHRQGEAATQLYVSCGTGYWGPPMRLGAPAEITKVVLTA